MLSAKGAKSRFSLLLLEEGEYYLDDYSAFCYPPGAPPDEAARRRAKGRLKVCSHSLVFEPDDVRAPLVRYPYAEVEHAGRLPEHDALLRHLPARTEVLSLVAGLAIEMKENNLNVPYVFRRGAAAHRFSLIYGSLADVLARVHELMEARRSGGGAALLQAIVEQRERAMLFDRSWIRDLDESRLLEVPASRVAPLVLSPGRLLVTQRRLYFQPLNAIDAHPVDVFALDDVRAVYRRRHALRRLALEIQFRSPQPSALALPGAAASPAAASSVLFSFRSEARRDEVYELLCAQPGVPSRAHMQQAAALAEATVRWQYGALSNLDYLLELNAAAGRTPLDLTQYPVMPWVLADYSSPRLDLRNPASFRDLSKPVGALNPTRLAAFRERYAQMLRDARSSAAAGDGGPGPGPPPPFLYGTHYSTPGYVLHFLVRTVPELMLRLQNGRFDSPDRMFHSLADTWHSVLHNPSDVKELIPEFFLPPGAFLLNAQGLPLGARSNGQPLGDVLLPPWAASAADFVEQHRAALESDHVSEHLHRWIDLIFGCKQRGEEAAQADNLFFYTTYEGAVDVDRITDRLQRAALETQIQEFGQTPAQLFTRPHPARAPRALRTGQVPPHLLPAPPPAPASAAPTTGRPPSPRPSPSRSSAGGGVLPPTGSLEELLGLRLGSGPGAAHPDGRYAGGAGDGDGELAPAPLMVVLAPDEPEPAHAPAALLGPALDRPRESPSPASGSEGAGALAGSLGTLALAGAAKVHREAVMGVSLSAQDPAILYSVSQDASLKIFSLATRCQLRSVAVSDLTLSACVLSADERSAFVASWDNNIYLYSVPYGRVLDTLSAHDDAVSCVALAPGAGAGAGELLLASGSWDSAVKLWAVRPTGLAKAPLADFVEHDTEVRCVAVAPDARLVASGAADGVVWLADVRARAPLRSAKAHVGAVHALHLTADQRLVSVGADGCVRVASLSALAAPVLYANTGEALNCMWTDGDLAVLGGARGTVRMWSLGAGLERHQLADPGARDPVSCLALSAAKDLLVTGSGTDGTVRIWK